MARKRITSVGSRKVHSSSRAKLIRSGEARANKSEGYKSLRSKIHAGRVRTHK